MLLKATMVRHLAVLAVVLCILGSIGGCKWFNKTPMYTGRTTLMEASSLTKATLSKDTEKRFTHLATIATSQRVLSRVADTLSDLGISTSPEVILSSAKVSRIKNTNILTVEVTLPSPNEAKTSADIMASEIKKVYAELCTSQLTEKREELEKRLEIAVNQEHAARISIDDYKAKLGNKADATQLTELNAEWETAGKEHLDIKKQLTKAKTEEQLAKSRVWLKTIDPAYVYPAK